ncbi:MAG: TonB-dependent receptor [Gammaproteobacteria bacterium]
MNKTPFNHKGRCALSLALASTFVLSTMYAQPTWAQLAQSEQTNIEEVVVTARKRTESLQDVPLTINAFDRKSLDEAGINNLQDVATFTPGFDFAQSFGRQDFRPAIRGQSTVQGGANAGLFIDGFYVGEGGATLPQSAVERVEVVKGPQGALYGRGTLSGAVNYVLKRPTKEFEGETSLTAGQDGELRGDVTLRGPLTDDFGYMVSLSYYDYDGQYKNGFAGNGAGAPAQSGDIGGESTQSVTAMLTWEPSESFDAALNLMWEYSDDDPYAIGLLSSSNNNCAFGPAPNPPAGTPGDGITASAYNNSGYYCGTVNTDTILDANGGRTNLETGFYNDMGTEFEAIRLGLTLGWNLANHRLQSKTSYHDYNTQARQDQSFGGGDYWLLPFGIGPSRFGFLSDTNSDADEWSQELTLSSTTEGPISYLVGAYYYSSEESSRERTSNQAGVVAVAPDYDVYPQIDQADRDASNWAVYGQLLWDTTETVNVGLELRYSADKVEAKGGPANLNLSETYDALLPRVTVNWDAMEDVMVYGVVSKGNKPGDFNTTDNIAASQRPVGEETAWNYELGVKTTLWDGRATFNTSVYYIDWTNQALTTNTVGADGTGSYSVLENLGKTEIKGLELELNVSVTDWWEVYTGYAYTDSDIKKYRLDAAGFVTSSGMGSGYEEPAQQGFPYAANGDIIISGTELPQVSKHQLTFSNTFSGQATQNWDWFARVDYLYNSERYAQVYNAADTGDANRVNLRLGLHSAAYDVELWMRNATDDDTSPALIRYVQVRNGTFGPDRAIGATLPQERAAGIKVAARF